MKKEIKYGSIVQWLERWSVTSEVAGSNPAGIARRLGS